MTAAEVAQVTAALARYERARADLDAQAAEGIARLRGNAAGYRMHTLGNAPAQHYSSRPAAKSALIEAAYR